ncbi:elongation of very long chain fatty acids protein 3 [Echinops telfairi]|uniref:Elongation of very long chain fatty acids protein n=1 Tax=Echinops telfairi TaxID=9371 RepID=A0ABM0IIX0_ECHTE|nr:elongation of very long chain fatty acids protein 3 [Echinops telfairi]
MAKAQNVTYEMDQLYQPYRFEDIKNLGHYVDEHWSASFSIAFTYLVFIALGQNYMKARKSFNLQKPLFLWSLSLAIFSILGTVRTWSFMGTLIYKIGFKYSVCYGLFTEIPVVKFWSIFFILSKIIELGDTAFIILRKRPLIFVHWYHHSTVLVYSFFGYKNRFPAGGWHMTMNFGVHAIMYTYYSLKALRVNPPRMLSMVITSLQILQMLAGALISFLSYVWRHEHGCEDTTADVFFWSAALYFSYIILFAHFFCQAYILPNNKHKTKSQ